MAGLEKFPYSTDVDFNQVMNYFFEFLTFWLNIKAPQFDTSKYDFNNREQFDFEDKFYEDLILFDDSAHKFIYPDRKDEFKIIVGSMDNDGYSPMVTKHFMAVHNDNPIIETKNEKYVLYRINTYLDFNRDCMVGIIIKLHFISYRNFRKIMNITINQNNDRTYKFLIEHFYSNEDLPTSKHDIDKIHREYQYLKCPSDFIPRLNGGGIYFNDIGVSYLTHDYNEDGNYICSYNTHISDKCIFDDDEYLIQTRNWMNDNNVDVDFFGDICNENDIMAFKMKFK